MSEALSVHALEPTETPLTPESWGKLGMWIFLAGDAMSFGGLIAAYAALRIGTPTWPQPSTILGIQLTAIMTFLLICSSVTMVKALSAIRHGQRAGLVKFLALTIFGGLCFLGMQAYEWHHLIVEEGLAIQHRLFDATFFILTGFHGCHVTGGVIYLFFVMLGGLRGKYSADHYNGVEIAGLYWHFVDLVWILIFTFVYLI